MTLYNRKGSHDQYSLQYMNSKVNFHGNPCIFIRVTQQTPTSNLELFAQKEAKNPNPNFTDPKPNPELNIIDTSMNIITA